MRQMANNGEATDSGEEAGNEAQATEISSKPHKRGKSTNRKLIMNVANTNYFIVKEVAKQMGYRLSIEDSGWDLYWTDSYVAPQMIERMRGYQRINHFPGTECIARKNLLARNLARMRKYLPAEYDFFPRTYLLPSDLFSLTRDFKQGDLRILISKPEASCQGKGIFLTRSLDDFKEDCHYVVQKYLDNPMLIDGLKFDLRIYVLLVGCHPLKIFVYEKGIARFATTRYEKPQPSNFRNMFMH